MNDKNIIWVKIATKSYYNLLIKLNDLNVTIYDNKKYLDYILLKINYGDYQKIKKYLISYKTEIVDITGIPKIKKLIKKYIFFIMGSIIGIILLLIVNNLIYKIDIKTNNSNIHSLLKKELAKYNLKALHFKKNHLEIEKIVNDIKNNNKDLIEWLEIRYDGLKMIVNVVEKTKENNQVEYKYCDVLAKTDAKIDSIITYRGIPLKSINDYVKKDEVLISGDIIHNEEVKNMVCASGIIYGEVWYKIKVSIPLEEEVIKYTGKNRYNISIKNNNKKYLIFKSRLLEKEEEEINIYKLNNFEINLVKEKEYIKINNKLTEEEAYNKGLNAGLEKIQLKLNKNEEILLQKVLKKEVNNSTIYLEIFVVTKESIGYTKNKEELEISDERINRENIS